MKRLTLILSLVVLFGAAGWWWWQSHGGNVMARAIAQTAGALTQTSVTVQGLEMAPTEGRGALLGLSIANPPGYKTPYAFKVDRIELELDWASLAQDVIRVRKLVIEAPDVVYEVADGRSNLEALQRTITQNTAGGKDKDTSSSSRRFIVQELTVRRAKAEASAALMNGKTVAVPLPDLTLRGLGQAQGGMTAGELGQVIAQALRQRVTSAIGLDALRESAGNVLQQAGKALRGAGQ